MGLSLKGLLRGGANLLRSPVGQIAGKFIPGVGAISTGLTLANMLRRKKRPGPVGTPGIASGPSIDQRLTGALDRSGGQAFRDQGYEGLTGFDPGAAYKEYLGGAEEAFGRQLKTGLADVQGTEVGRGRLDSGFGALDETEFARELASDYRREASSRALDASGQNLSRLSRIGDIEAGQTGTYLDMLTGAKDREQAAANARNERKGNRTNAILGAIGTIGGAAAGAYLGRKR